MIRKMLAEEVRLRKRMSDIVFGNRHWSWSMFDALIRAFEKAVRADERERCAMVAESYSDKRATCGDPECAGPGIIADAIRSRK